MVLPEHLIIFSLPTVHQIKIRSAIQSQAHRIRTSPSNTLNSSRSLKLATIDIVSNQPLLQQWPPKLANLTLS